MTEVPKPDSATARIKARLDELGLRIQKGFGQNFLIDRTILRDITAAAELSAGDIVVEVGPGLGVLTTELAAAAGRVVAVELDRGLAEGLRDEFRDRTNVTIVNGDILGLSPETLLEPYRMEVEASGYKVVANVPYYITSPVLRHFLEARWKPRLMVVTVQREVGESITAGAGDMSLLGAIIQFYAWPKIVRKVSARAFYPAPKVDSVVLRLDVYGKPPVKVADVDAFFRVIKAGFSARRKQLHNPLARGLVLPQTVVAEALKESGIDPMRRAETLTLKEWAIISERLRQYVDTSCTSQTKPRSGSTGQTR
ncbi:MAG: 16S rRNA (adenine(1518)-N(6)/adenine(1519)-N(6))-dimethyltransferase RsmA [Chloroflexota bacterium]